MSDLAEEENSDPPRLFRAAAFGLVLLLLTLIPPLLGNAWAPDGDAFLFNRPIGWQDRPTNLARIERVSRGEVLIKNPYSAAEGNVGLLRPTYLIAGVLAKGVGAEPAFQLTRVVFGVLFVLALYRLAVFVFATEVERWFAVLLGTLGSGLSWFTWLLNPNQVDLFQWCDTIQPEANVFASLMDSPHFVSAHWLLVEFVLGLLLALDARRPRYGKALFASATAVAFLLFDRPYQAPTCAVLTAIALVLAWRRGVDRARIVRVGAGILVAALIPVGTMVALLSVDPTLTHWSRFNQTPSPNPVYYAGAYGLMWAFAAKGAVESRRVDGQSWRFLVAWAGVLWVLIYVPFSFQRRLVEGWQLPLAFLAAVRLFGLWASGRRLLAAGLLAFCCVGTPLLVGADLASYRRAEPEHYVSVELIAGMRWIGEHGSIDAVVLASQEVSRLVPAYSGCRVVNGHRWQGHADPVAMASLRKALHESQQRGTAPRFSGGLKRTRYVILLRGECVVGGLAFLPTWAEPVFQTSDVTIFELP